MLGTGPWEDAAAQQRCPNSFPQEGPVLFSQWLGSTLGGLVENQPTLQPVLLSVPSYCVPGFSVHRETQASSSTGAGKGACR